MRASRTEDKMNPANAVEKVTQERTRVPMSLPMQKLSVPDIPGYHLHWMNGNSQRISQALKAGYEFVNDEEVNVTNTGLANDSMTSGNTDMGSRVSVSAGSDLDSDGNESRLYLMKIRQEWWEEDQSRLEDRNEQIAQSIRGGNPEAGVDNSNRYIPDANKKSVAELFTRKVKR